MPNLLGLGPELESVIAGVLGYFVAGVLIFFTCFVLNKFFIWHRQRMLRKKRKEQGLDDDDDYDNVGIVIEDLQQALSESETVNTDNKITAVKSSKPGGLVIPR